MRRTVRRSWTTRGPDSGRGTGSSHPAPPNPAGLPRFLPPRGNEHRAHPWILRRWPRLNGGAQSRRSPVSPLLPANLPPRPATAGCRQRPLPNGLNSRTDSGPGGQPVRVASEVDMVGPHLVRPGTVLRSGPLPRIPVDLRAGCAGLHLGPPVALAFAASGQHLRPRLDELQLPAGHLIRGAARGAHRSP